MILTKDKDNNFIRAMAFNNTNKINNLLDRLINQQNERKEAYACTQSEKSFQHIEKRKACSNRISLMNWQRKALPFPIKPYPTGREILLNQALPYFTKCVESLVLLTCMKHILE